VTRSALAQYGLLLVALAGGCGLPDPQYYAEVPPESRNWAPASGPPDWVARTAEEEAGTLRIVVEAKSNDRFVASKKGGAVLQVRRKVGKSLASVVGAEDAERAAAAAEGSTRLVARVAKDEVLSRTADAGNTLSTVWTLCEVPLVTVLDPLPPEKRDAARAALTR
jgi:hypothetical protein